MYFVQFKHLNLKLQWRDSEKKEVLFLRRILFIYYLFASKPTGFGKAMGSLVSAVFANIVIEDAKKGPCHFTAKPFFWKRYINDAISAVFRNEVERLHRIKSIDPSI